MWWNSPHCRHKEGRKFPNFWWDNHQGKSSHIHLTQRIWIFEALQVCLILSPIIRMDQIGLFSSLQCNLHYTSLHITVLLHYTYTPTLCEPMVYIRNSLVLKSGHSSVHSCYYVYNIWELSSYHHISEKIVWKN